MTIFLCGNLLLKWNYINVNDGLYAFKESLKLFDQNNSYFIWIAYATRESPQVIQIEKDHDIEMVCTFFADETSPLTTHMRIFNLSSNSIYGNESNLHHAKYSQKEITNRWKYLDRLHKATQWMTKTN